MKPVLFLFIVVCVVLTGAYAVITVYDDNMAIGRMWETPAIKPQKIHIIFGDQLFHSAQPVYRRHASV